jgi:hypothetical protein
LSYKHLRNIIAPELYKNKSLKSDFDLRGGRCYIFVDEVGGNYIFSSVPILNAKENQLDLQKIFNSKAAYWRIYLYKVM